MARRLALLIGNQCFEDGSGFEALRGPHNDVDALAALLRDPAQGGFAEVRPLKDASFKSMAREVRALLRGAQPDDEVLIHYSGHGQPDDEGRLFFAAADSHAEELATTALRAGDLQEWIAKSPARAVVLLLDCCFAGAFGKVLTGGLRGAQETSIQEQLREAVERARGRYILTSSTSWQTSQEAEGEADGVWMGRFTRAVVERLSAESGDAAGWVRFSHLAAHVRHAFPGHDPREFRADAEGDPAIARARPRETPEQRRAKLLAAWVETERLPEFVYALAFEAVHANGPAGLVKLVARLLDTPGMTPAAFAAAVRNALPDAVPPAASHMGPTLPRTPGARVPHAKPESLDSKRTLRLRPAWAIGAIALALAIFLFLATEWNPEQPAPPQSLPGPGAPAASPAATWKLTLPYRPPNAPDPEQQPVLRIPSPFPLRR